MHCEYTEILEAMGEPKWWNEFAVPRFVDFHPSKVANIYAERVVLLEIACQACGERFLVAESESMKDRALKRGWDLPDHFPPHFGDPPRFADESRCCPAGPTMNVELIGVRERWQRTIHELHGWRKVDRFDFESIDAAIRSETEEE